MRRVVAVTVAAPRWRGCRWLGRGRWAARARRWAARARRGPRARRRAARARRVGLGEQLGQASLEPRHQRRVARRPIGLVRPSTADPQPVLRLVEQSIGDADDPDQGQAERIRIERGVHREFHGEQRTLVLADAELGERVLVVPVQEPAIRLAEQVVDRRREVGPADEGQRRVEDDRHAQVEAAPTVEHEIPAGDPITLGSIDRFEVQVGEPALDVGRAHVRRTGIGWHGPRSLSEDARGRGGRLGGGRGQRSPCRVGWPGAWAEPDVHGMGLPANERRIEDQSWPQVGQRLPRLGKRTAEPGRHEAPGVTRSSLSPSDANGPDPRPRQVQMGRRGRPATPTAHEP